MVSANSSFQTRSVNTGSFNDSNKRRSFVYLSNSSNPFLKLRKRSPLLLPPPSKRKRREEIRSSSRCRYEFPIQLTLPVPLFVEAIGIQGGEKRREKFSARPIRHSGDHCADDDRCEEEKRRRIRSRLQSQRSIIELRPAVPRQNTGGCSVPGFCREQHTHTSRECTRASINIAVSDTGRSSSSLDRSYPPRHPCKGNCFGSVIEISTPR